MQLAIQCPFDGLTTVASCSLYFKYGKRVSFFTFLAIQCLSGVLTAMAPDFLYFTILRFFVGITSSAVVSSPIALAQELVGPEYRNKVSVFSQSARSLGFMILSIMAFLVRDWSHIALVTTLPFLAFFLYWWVFPESPDWLKEKGRYEEVGRIFEVIAQANGRELTPEYIINMKRRFRIEKSMLEERKRNGTQTHYSVWNLFSGSNTCKKTTAIIFICVNLTQCAGQLGEKGELKKKKINRNSMFIANEHWAISVIDYTWERRGNSILPSNLIVQRILRNITYQRHALAFTLIEFGKAICSNFCQIFRMVAFCEFSSKQFF
ncbi:solute carrier family 22 member 1 [Caerostris extrusa]|uniref:Solute carrier family 22 member 1 n=1 Tax=Caerostris extrusa TaxID=172846 RepID=A0AAV4X8U2_CAEEX|nr:solute carrier family 22 member 1 [Caerostris extrusa]